MSDGYKFFFPPDIFMSGYGMWIKSREPIYKSVIVALNLTEHDGFPDVSIAGSLR